MSKERKAELQRKLAMTAVPRPPADLLDRIKADIPADIGVPGRDPSLWRSALVMRVAASLMLLVTTGLVTWRVLQPDVRRPVPVRVQQREPIVPAITRTIPRAANQEADAAPVAETASTVIESPLVIPQSAPAPPPPPPAEAASPARSEEFAARENATEMADATDLRETTIAESITVSGGADASAGLTVAASAPASTLPPPPPAPAMTAQRAANATMRKEMAPEKSRRFSLSDDGAEFSRVRHSLAEGVRPENVDVEALINHFAIAPAPKDHAYVLTTELSSAPLDRERLLLRVSVDVSSAAALTDSRLKVDFPADAVREARRIGGGDAFAATTRPSGTSVTVVYEIEPRAWLPPATTVAEVGLEWPEKTTTQKVTAGQTETWGDASRRHRLATLAGLWAESLSRSATNVMLATLARELHEQNPSDPLARDLSAAVEASTRIQR